jgi:hypothetical protein
VLDEFPCGTYTPAYWINSGETATLTLQLGAPLATEVSLPYFFGCTPDSAYSHAQNRTIFFTYFDSNAPSDRLVTVAECDDVSVCGAYYANYDDSQGGGNMAVITDVFYHPGDALGGGRGNVTYGYNNYQIGSVRARYDSVLDTIGELDNSKEIRSKSSSRPTSQLAKILRLVPGQDDKTVETTKIDFYYDENDRVATEIIKVNTTHFDDFIKMVVDIRYRVDGYGDIMQVRDIYKNSSFPDNQMDFTYDDNGQIIKLCDNGCDTYRETFAYDNSGRLTEVKYNGTEYKFKYESGQIKTADFGDDFGLWTFNYDYKN